MNNTLRLFDLGILNQSKDAALDQIFDGSRKTFLQQKESPTRTAALKLFELLERHHLGVEIRRKVVPRVVDERDAPRSRSIQSPDGVRSIPIPPPLGHQPRALRHALNAASCDPGGISLEDLRRRQGSPV